MTSDAPTRRDDAASTRLTGDQRRVIAATAVGTTIEYYDFFVYATAAPLVFATLFFEPAGPQIGTLVAFASTGIAFLFRPLGAFIAGHLGDRFGRRFVLVLTLVLMGGATTLIGLLPTYGQIGVAAPILLLLLRVLQGISAGGEWGGAALIAVEHAPLRKRGLFGAAPQIGVPLGMLLAAGALTLMNVIAPGDAFLEWGWRVPFLFSVVLIVVGQFVRRRVEESPVFTVMAERKVVTRNPIGQLFRHHWKLVLVAALMVAGANAPSYMVPGGFLQNYSIELGVARGDALLGISISAVVWAIATWFSAFISDRIGRRRTYVIGWAILLLSVVVMFPLTGTGTAWGLVAAACLLNVGVGFIVGPLSAYFAELFPSSVRFSGVSISYALAAVLGGAFAPLIAQSILQATGTTTLITVYLAGMVVLGFVMTLLLRDRSGIPLGPEHEEEQRTGQFVLERRT